MSAQYVRIVDAATLVPNWVTPRPEVLDLGTHRVIAVTVRVLKAGTATDANTVVKLQTAAVNEEGAFVDVGSSVRVDSAAPPGATFFEIPAFSRFIRAATGTGSFAGGPVVNIDLVAKS